METLGFGGSEERGWGLGASFWGVVFALQGGCSPLVVLRGDLGGFSSFFSCIFPTAGHCKALHGELRLGWQQKNKCKCVFSEQSPPKNGADSYCPVPARHTEKRTQLWATNHEFWLSGRVRGQTKTLLSLK